MGVTLSICSQREEQFGGGPIVDAGIVGLYSKVAAISRLEKEFQEFWGRRSMNVGGQSGSGR